MGKGGVFITLYDEDSLDLYLQNTIYSFLMKPETRKESLSKSRHYAILADYSAIRGEEHVFFFLKREIIYGGKIKKGNKAAAFYLNGQTSPLGEENNAVLFWDESSRYQKTEKEGVFKRDNQERAQPFVIMFDKNENTGKYISSDELYFELGKYNFPLMSNTLQNSSFCKLIPKEVEILVNLISNSNRKKALKCEKKVEIENEKTLQKFEKKHLTYTNFINEAQLEHTILADFSFFETTFNLKNYVLCRQVPMCPFKPFNLDKVDISVYDLDNPIKEGAIPNIIIELKKDKGNKNTVIQINKYLDWLKLILSAEEFRMIKACVIASDFVKSYKNEKEQSDYSNIIDEFKIIDLFNREEQSEND
ncbi:MAG: hypothetical protein ACRDD4_00430 [Culicoidibacterales bacterium]